MSFRDAGDAQRARMEALEAELAAAKRENERLEGLATEAQLIAARAEQAALLAQAGRPLAPPPPRVVPADPSHRSMRERAFAASAIFGVLGLAAIAMHALDAPVAVVIAALAIAATAYSIALVMGGHLFHLAVGRNADRSVSITVLGGVFSLMPCLGFFAAIWTSIYLFRGKLGALDSAPAIDVGRGGWPLAATFAVVAALQALLVVLELAMDSSIVTFF